MPNENQNMRGKVVNLLRSVGGMAVENPACPGTPDVYYMHGWVELKEADDWPVRPTTPLRLKHFTKQQRVWAKTHILKGGVSTVLLKVGRLEWYLLDGLIAADRLGSMTREEIQSASRLTFTQGLDSERLFECLTTLTNSQMMAAALAVSH
tara:strand:- start:7114 stop:7566 length:453 start_codon:yes stop_codon:yes gene_type:complete